MGKVPFAVVVATLTCACDGGSSQQPCGADAASDAIDTDAGSDAPSGPYPAAFPAPPQVTTLKGPVIGSGVVVPVFWSSDALEGSLETFLGQLSTSTYWSATTKEYGAGNFSLAPSVVIATAAPATIDGPGIEAWLASHADGSDAAWPKADANTVYALFFPAATTITLAPGVDSCKSFGGDHASTKLADNTPFAYAILPRCGNLEALTGATSHELVEWATDPFGFSAVGQWAYATVDTPHLFWMSSGSEIADMCALTPSAFAPLLGTFVVQRVWSNAAIKAGHDPCVPAPPDPYFNAVPDLPDTAPYTLFGQPVTTRAVKVPVGTSKTIAVHLFSDAPTAPWTVSAEAAIESTGALATGALSFSFDKNTGQNGDVLQLTITASWQPSSPNARFTITSTNAQNLQHQWVGLVQF